MMTTNDLRAALAIGRMGLDSIASVVNLSARRGEATVRPLSPDLADETRALAERIARRLGWRIEVLEA